MKRILFFLLLATACTAGPQRELKLHYDRPATFFEEALPVGNGRIGAMVYGDPVHEHLSLNDITLWTGEPDKGTAHPDIANLNLGGDGAEALAAVREASVDALAAVQGMTRPAAEQVYRSFHPDERPDDEG